MMNIFHNISLMRYWTETKANALAETAILFPVFLSLLMGVYDLGQGIIINQKSITSSQVMADLIARNREVSEDIVLDIVRAGQMAIEPFPLAQDGVQLHGYDIVSVLFDEDGNPDIQWRMTDNMLPNDDPLLTVENILELENEGLVIVTTQYRYTPYFAEFVTDEILMREVAFLRGRSSSLIVCDDCPGGS
ncbi:MAG: hypothetical protein AAF569_00740 [Pseudomonadota bacterium]